MFSNQKFTIPTWNENFALFVRVIKRLFKTNFTSELNCLCGDSAAIRSTSTEGQQTDKSTKKSAVYSKTCVTGATLNTNLATFSESSTIIYTDVTALYPRIMIIYLFTAIGLSPGGSGYSTCKQNMKLVITKFKSGGLHEKHVVATWNVGNHLSVCL